MMFLCLCLVLLRLVPLICILFVVTDLAMLDLSFVFMKWLVDDCVELEMDDE